MKSKTVLFGFAALFVLLAFTVAPVAAVKPADNLNGNAQVVKLVEKDSTDWSIVDGAFGSIMYQKSKFVFNGHDLTPETEYTLINFVDPWGTPYIPLGNAMTDIEGDIHIKGGETVLIPYTYVDGEYAGQTGAKIWLVPTSNLEGGLAWNPDAYLFETSLVV